MNNLEAAQQYIERGFRPIPIPGGQKRPVVDGWQNLRIGLDDATRYFGRVGNIGLILGEPSAGLVDIDLDCEEACRLADQYLPATPAITGRLSAPGSHRWYISQDAKTAKHTDPFDRSMIVELRATGCQTVVGPSIHPSGERYEVLDQQPATVSAPMLAACVEALAKAVVKQRHGERSPPGKAPAQTPTGPIYGPPSQVDSSDVERRAVAYLAALPPGISGQGGHAATYAAATALVHGFAMEPERALALLMQYFNPRCEPQWSERELRHKIEDAASREHDRPLGWLRDQQPAAGTYSDVDLSRFQPLLQIAEVVEAKPEPVENNPADPGPFPERLLEVPGFLGEVMAHNLATAFKPQPVLALAAAITLLGTLTGRKITDKFGSRTNVYCLGVCGSGGGKERARQVNKDILYNAGLDAMIGPEGLASHSGLIGAVEQQPAILMQLDEIGRLLKTLGNATQSPHLFHIATVLMKLFTSSNSIYIGDAYADTKRNKKIYQPHACMYGTTVPQSLYEGLSAESLTDGFLSRMLVFEVADHDPEPQEHETLPVPEAIVEEARWWGNFNPGGNLSSENPQPRVVEYTSEAAGVMTALEKHARKERKDGKEAATMWTRTTEKARKLALIHACSTHPESPLVGVEAAEWAAEVCEYLTRKMIHVADAWVAETPFEKKRKRLLRAIQEAGERGLTRTQVYRKTRHLPGREREELLESLRETGEATLEEVHVNGPTKLVFRATR